MLIQDFPAFGDAPHPELYPSLHHFSIIADAANMPIDPLRELLADCEVVEELAVGQRTGGGRYVSLRVSLNIRSREELDRVHRDIRAVEGVKMLL